MYFGPLTEETMKKPAIDPQKQRQRQWKQDVVILKKDDNSGTNGVFILFKMII